MIYLLFILFLFGGLLTLRIERMEKSDLKSNKITITIRTYVWGVLINTERIEK
jgi:hypothetical protein